MEATGAEARDAIIAHDVVDRNRTLQAVADEWGISRERVRQIVKAQRPEFSAFDRRLAYRAALAQRLHDESIARRETYRTRLDTSGHGMNRAFTPEGMLQIMRDLTDALGDLSERRWSSLPASDEIPCTALYIIRFGSWNKAKIAAGLPVSLPRRTYDKIFEDMDLIDSVAEFLRTASSEDGWFGAQHYEKWRLNSAAPDFHPSLALLRMRLGRWNDVKAAAILRNQEQEQS